MVWGDEIIEKALIGRHKGSDSQAHLVRLVCRYIVIALYPDSKYCNLSCRTSWFVAQHSRPGTGLDEALTQNATHTKSLNDRHILKIFFMSGVLMRIAG